MTMHKGVYFTAVCKIHASNFKGGSIMDITMIVDTIWVVLAAVLVFFMNLGFAAVESRQPLTRSASPG